MGSFWTPWKQDLHSCPAIRHDDSSLYLSQVCPHGALLGPLCSGQNQEDTGVLGWCWTPAG